MNHKFRLFVGFAWALTGWGMMNNAHAANVAVVCADLVSQPSVANAVSIRFRQVMAKRELEGHYDHLEFLNCQTAEEEKIFLERLSSFGSLHRTDVLDLRVRGSGSPVSDFDRTLKLALSTESLGKFSKLRWVYATMMDGSPSELATRWMQAGAKAVSIQLPASTEVQDRSFLAELLKQWSQGAWLTDSVAQATLTARQFSAALSPWLSRSRATPTQGVQIFGVDVRQSDAFTRQMPSDRRTWFGTIEPVRQLRTIEAVSSDAELSGVQLYGALTLPGAPMMPTVGGVSELIERAAGPTWDLLKNGFPDPVPAIPGRIGDDESDGELSWIDGDGLRYFLKPIQTWLGDGTNRFLQEILGLRLQRKEAGLRTAFHLKQAMTLSLTQAGFKIPDGEIESLHFPRTLRLSIRIVNGVANIQFLPVVDEPLGINISWNGVPLTLVPTLARADLTTGDGEIEATVLGGLLSFVAKVNLYEKKFGGIDIWESIDRSLSRFELPKLQFVKK